MPRYLQLLALISFHAFLDKGVDVAIYETYHGGEFDSTNVVQKPVVTGITSLGIDHVKSLGSTIESIAWHKSGIFKAGCPALSSIQQASAAEILERRAKEKDVVLEFVNIDPTLPTDQGALPPMVQRKNFSLAIAIVNAFLRVKASRCSLESTDVIQAKRRCFWPGRFQQIVEGKHEWFLDGAHNEMSLIEAARWFSETTVEKQG